MLRGFFKTFDVRLGAFCKRKPKQLNKMDSELKKMMIASICNDNKLLARLLAMNRASEQLQCLMDEKVLDLDETMQAMKARLQDWRQVHRRRSYTKAVHFAKCASQLAEIASKSATNCLVEMYTKAMGVLPSLRAQIGERYDAILALSLRLTMARAQHFYKTERYAECIDDLQLLREWLDVDQDDDSLDLMDNKRLFQVAQPEGEPIPSLMDVLHFTIKCFHRIKIITLDDLQVMSKALANFDNKPVVRGLAKTILGLLTLNSNHCNYDLSNSAVNYVDCVQANDGEDNVKGKRYNLHAKVKAIKIDGKGRAWMVDDVEKKGLDKGEVVLVERPYSAMIEKGCSGRYCDYCMAKLDKANWVGCDMCDEVSYCCVVCRNAARLEYHQYECGHLGLLRSIGCTSTLLSRVINRIGLDRALVYHDLYSPSSYSIDKFVNKDLLKQVCNQQLDEKQSFEAYRMFTSLTNHQDRPARSMDIYFLFKAIETALIMLITHPRLSVDCFDDETGKVKIKLLLSIVDVFYTHIQRFLVNIFGFYDVQQANGRKASPQFLIGNCQFLLASLFNHSCQPNLAWTIEHGHIVVRASR